MYIKITKDRVINISNIIRIDRFSMRTASISEINEWEEKYDELMNKLKTTYILKHPEILASDKTDSEILDIIHKKFDKHIKNYIGEQPDSIINNYLILTRTKDTYYISEETYNKLCKILNIDMSSKFDDFVNDSETIDYEIFGIM